MSQARISLDAHAPKPGWKTASFWVIVIKLAAAFVPLAISVALGLGFIGAAASQEIKVYLIEFLLIASSVVGGSTAVDGYAFITGRSKVSEIKAQTQATRLTGTAMPMSDSAPSTNVTVTTEEKK